jgi:transposase-like protein
MKIHANAALTIRQRQEIQRLYQQEQCSITALARQFNTSTKTIRKWVRRESTQDRSSAPHQRHRVVTEAYEQAVLEYRHQHPEQGPIRIAQALQPQFPQAHRGTVLRILQQAKLTHRRSREKQSRWRIPVGRHRAQMDIQQLPAIAGQSGFEYKISIIHLATRMKYSEIHPDSNSSTVAAVFRRALDQLPPFLSSGRTMP